QNPSLADGLQAQLSALRTTERMRKVECKTEEAKARFHSISQPNASRWLTALPTEPNLKLDDSEFRIAVKTRLGIPIAQNLPTICGLCNKNFGPDFTAH